MGLTATVFFSLTRSSKVTYESLEHEKKALEIKIKDHGEQHAKVAASLNDLGCTLLEKNKPQEALEYLLSASKILRNVSDVAATVNNMGCALWLIGEREKAAKYFMQVQRIIEKVQLNVFAGVNNNIGCVLFLLNRPEDSSVYLKSALKIWKQVHGEQHYNTCIGFNNVGVIYHIIGDFLKSTDYLLKAIEIKGILLSGNKQYPDAAKRTSDRECTVEELD